MIKKTLFKVTAVVVVLFALVAAFSQFPVDRHRKQIESRLSLLLGRRVRIQKVGLTLWPLTFHFQKLVIADSRSFSRTGPFVMADEATVPVDITSVLSGQLKLNDITFVHPRISFVRSQAGDWNFSSLELKAADPAQAQGTPGFSRIQMDNAVIVMQDESHPADVVRYDRLDVKVTDISPGKPFRLAASLHLPGKRAESLVVSAQIGPMRLDHLSLTPVDAHVDLQHLWAGNLARFLTDPESASVYGGSINGTADLKIQQGVLSTSGTMTVHGFELGGEHLLFPLNLIFRAEGNLDTGLYRLNSLDLGMERQHYSIAGTVNAKQAPAEMDLAVIIPSGSVAPLANLLDVLGDSLGIEATGTVNVNLQVTGSLSNPSLSGSAALLAASFKPRNFTRPVEVQKAKLTFSQNQVSVHDIAAKVGSSMLHGDILLKGFQNPEISLNLGADSVSLAEWGALGAVVSNPKQKKANGWWSRLTGGGALSFGTLLVGGINVNAAESKIAFGKGSLTAAPFRGDLYGGTVTGRISADLRAAKPTYEASIALDRVDSNNFLTSFTQVQDTLFGTLGAKADVQFDVLPDGNLIHALNGTTSFTLTGGRLRHLDIPGQLNQLTRMPNAPSLSDETQFKSLSANLKLANGEALVSNLRAELSQSSITGSGTINLPKEVLNLQLLGGLKATNRMVSSAGDLFVLKQGQLFVPLNLTGTASKPLLSSDAAALAKLRQ